MADSIQYLSGPSAQELFVREGDKLFLTKTWYNYRFEVNTKIADNALQMSQADSVEYEEAMSEVAFPLSSIGEYKIYFLNCRLANYPSALALSFLDDSTLVFGTYYPLPKAKIHQLAVHELGHQVDFKLMTPARWKEYLKLRGLTDREVYDNAGSIYENRPQEIFAEDFRLLFGGAKAREIPHLNRSLPDTAEVPGLKDFFLSLYETKEER